MEMLWFMLAAVMVAIYVVMDGFDFGAGALHLWVAKNDRERRQVLAAIGPFWDGNEVWLLAGGGVLLLAFPKVLASGLSGFYLAIMLILWVLILRGISIEFRSHIKDGMWHAFWDATFATASTLAPVLFGAALGNLIRGVPFQEDGWFALSLFESFSPRGELGLLDWYTVLAGVLALAALLHHGALFLAWKTDGLVRERSLKAASRLFPAVIVLLIAATAATAALVPDLYAALAARPLAWLATILFVAGLAGAFFARRAGRDLLAFVSSGGFLLGHLGATAASIYPVMIRSIDTPSQSLTAGNAAASHESLLAGLRWWPVGFVLAIFYVVVLFRLHRGRVQATDSEGY
ncbi:MAG: cytochrome d ubiquinol oxidase subunit II [Candidatus Eisenbacteria bacterium]|uniref:Cytochrome d ubiquinol oxidase subunit II n=1 Tax=Eiseniibacteriota bacterium TaxID=2212470 RepID=A0A948W1X3_UNCEI|nr:cytochrome d ubiquinol oxidase subunit II [Candidatus Eisenbacteria bacterium]MBU1948501.1 cytochrome d ubiquinol oxidase subunit II [Candidatus Eisenbacteria bacterium]MBU2689317.1 cytochrome d ubiquinol oxidase subunit II [Candidatus Eisenbacteria bacterium]